MVLALQQSNMIPAKLLSDTGMDEHAFDLVNVSRVGIRPATPPKPHGGLHLHELVGIITWSKYPSSKEPRRSSQTGQSPVD